MRASRCDYTRLKRKTPGSSPLRKRERINPGTVNKCIVSDSVTQGDVTLAPVRTVISADRFEGYERFGGGVIDALARYTWNTQLSASLYSTLLHLEVAFRNRLHDAIATRYPRGPWRDVDCWLGRIPPIIAPAELAQVDAAIARLRRKGKPIVPGRVVAELTFGF